jgi:hypothetical protein
MEAHAESMIRAPNIPAVKFLVASFMQKQQPTRAALEKA